MTPPRRLGSATARPRTEARIFEIFRAGQHTDMRGITVNVSESDLATTAAAFSVLGQRAPLVLGHPPDNQPAYGEVRALRAIGPSLFAAAEVSTGLIEAVRAGRYRHVSASFYPPAQCGIRRLASIRCAMSAFLERILRRSGEWRRWSLRPATTAR